MRGRGPELARTVASVYRSSSIGSPESRKRASQRAAFGYDSTIFTLEQAKQALTAIQDQPQPDPELYFHLVRVCANERSLALGKQVHSQLLNTRVDRDVYCNNNLIHMYGKCGSVPDALSVFNEMSCRTVVSWTSMITVLSQSGKYESAFKIYESMMLDGTSPNRVTFFTVIDVCARGVMPGKAKVVAGNVEESEHHGDSTVGTALVNMFGKCGDLEAAAGVFRGIREKTVVSWTALITVYVNHGRHAQALEYFERMQLKLVTPNEITFVAALNACAACDDLERGKVIHGQLSGLGLVSDVLVGTALVNLYSKCGRLRDALKAFSMILERDVVSYNAVLAAISELGNSADAFNVFATMLFEGHTPTKATFVSLLHACCDMERGRTIHSFVECEQDIIVRTALLNMYGKCGAVADAVKVFESMDSRNLISWNTMFAVYADHGRPTEAFFLYRRMQQEGVRPDEITFMSLLNAFAGAPAVEFGKQVHAHLVEIGLEDAVSVANSLLDMYGKCGSLDQARLLFGRMSTRNTISWTCMITACFQDGREKEALLFYHQMLLEGIVPDRLTFATTMNACANLPSLKDGKALHACVVESGIAVELSLGTAIVNMYGKCSFVEEAKAVFDALRVRDPACWNAMTGAYAQHGHAEEAIRLLRTMQQEDVQPDAVSFVIALSACRHGGLLADGLECLASMTQVYGLVPTAEHYSSLIDLLGRTGRLDEAEKYVKEFKHPNPQALSSLLDACRVHGDVERATQAAERCLRSDPDDPPTYVTLSNIYAES